MISDYGRAFERLELFANESQNWDGHGASPAPEGVVVGVKSLLASAIEHELPPPSLTLSHSGSVSVVWNKPRCFYVTLLVSSRQSFDHTILQHGEKPVCGRSVGMTISESLAAEIRSLCSRD